MFKATVIVEAETREELRPALLSVLNVPADGKATATGQTAPTSQAWTAQDFTGFWNGLTTDCKAILGVIAKKPDACPVKDIETALHWTGLSIAGRMSSVGHQMRRYPGRPWPAERHYNPDVYRMLAEVVEWIRRLSGGQKAA